MPAPDHRNPYTELLAQQLLAEHGDSMNGRTAGGSNMKCPPDPLSPMTAAQGAALLAEVRALRADIKALHSAIAPLKSDTLIVGAEVAQHLPKAMR